MAKEKQITQKELDKVEKNIKDGVAKMVKDINSIHDTMEKHAQTQLDDLDKRVTQIEKDIKIMCDDMTKNMKRLANLENA